MVFCQMSFEFRVIFALCLVFCVYNPTIDLKVNDISLQINLGPAISQQFGTVDNFATWQT